MAEVIDKPKPEDAADVLYEYADNFVTHWMDDDGLDAEERKEVDAASDQMNDAHNTVKAALKAAAEMKTALEDLHTQLRAHVKMNNVKKYYSLLVADNAADKAIRAAEAAGVGGAARRCPNCDSPPPVHQVGCDKAL